MTVVELEFPVLGTTIATDHGYALYGALSGLVATLHAKDALHQIGPISGESMSRNLLRLNERSSFRCRLPSDAIPTVLPLSGKAIELAGHRVRLGVPHIRPLIFASTLVARLVTIRVQGIRQPTPEQFLTAVRWRLTQKAFSGEPTIPIIRTGPAPANLVAASSV
jgi:CRISPR-associated protein Cas6